MASHAPYIRNRDEQKFSWPVFNGLNFIRRRVSKCSRSGCAGERADEPSGQWRVRAGRSRGGRAGQRWGFWEGSHWRAKEGAALFRRDWSPRPAEEAYEDLVLRQWRTNAQGKTNAAGIYALRGFLGDYAVTVTQGGRTKTIQIHLPKAGQMVKVMLP